MEIKEEAIKYENVMVGGMSFIKPSDVPKTFKIEGTITNVEPVQTDWGTRYEFIIVGDDGNEYPISSWNFLSRRRYSALEMINSRIVLKAYNDKKFLLEKL